MKATPIIFLAAMGLLTLAVAVPRRVEPPMQERELDGEGIAAIRVEGEVAVDVDYSPDCACERRQEGRAPGPPPAPRVRWPSDGDGDVVARRDGDTLVLVASGFDGHTIELLPPPGVRRIDVPSGTLSAEARLPAMSIRTRADFTWQADADALDIEQTPTPACLLEEHCFVSLDVGGRIGAVEVEAGRAVVKLQSPERFDRVRVRLAPRSELALQNARRVDHIAIEYVDTDGSPLTAEAAARARADALDHDDDNGASGDAALSGARKRTR